MDQRGHPTTQTFWGMLRISGVLDFSGDRWDVAEQRGGVVFQNAPCRAKQFRSSGRGRGGKCSYSAVRRGTVRSSKNIVWGRGCVAKKEDGFRVLLGAVFQASLVTVWDPARDFSVF